LTLEAPGEIRGPLLLFDVLTSPGRAVIVPGMNSSTPLPAQSAIVAVPASQPGALAGYESRCTCGLVIRSSMETIIRQDVWEHAAWHAKRGR